VGTTGQRGLPRALYSTAAQVIPALLIALAIEFRTLIAGLRRFLAIDALVVLAILNAFFSMTLGEFVALDVISCGTQESCRSTSQLHAVYLAIINGTALILVAFLIALRNGLSDR
jgi:hypothetical protein